MLIQQNPALAPPDRGASASPLAKTLTGFYRVVGSDSAPEGSRERRRLCQQTWAGLARHSKATPELAAELQLAQAYLAVECDWGSKSMPLLKSLLKRHQQTDLVYYSAHFWYAEALLEAEKTSSAVERYRFVLGEIESPLYPIALYRTAHCYWDAEQFDKARTYLGYVLDWTRGKAGPAWVVTLRTRATMELEGLGEGGGNARDE